MYIFIVVWSVHISSELKFDIKGAISATPLFFIFLYPETLNYSKFSTKKCQITKRNSQAYCRMVFEMRKQLLAWMEHRLQISLKRYALLMEDKMVAGAFGCATNYGWDSPLNSYDCVKLVFKFCCFRKWYSCSWCIYWLLFTSHPIWPGK